MSEVVPAEEGDHPALAWRRAGLMAVTGRADGPGLVCPAPLAAAADGALMALRALAPDAGRLPANGALLLGERARLMGLRRQGRISANGSCRLIEARDGRIALNLAREDDRDLLPILFEDDAVTDWPAIEAAAPRHDAAMLLARGIELGLPIARDAAAEPLDSPFVIERAGAAARSGTPLVLDFAGLWAGPLAASLLGMLGAEVVKVESARRHDGARHGHAGFYDLLNAGKRSITVDFDDPGERDRLRALVDRADIVIEGSRPRALAALGIDRADVVAGGGLWIAITAHDDPDRVGFGDDAAVAGGLVRHMTRGWGEPLFAGDAIADPLGGLHAALAAWVLWHRRRAALVRLSLAKTTAFACGTGIAEGDALADWQRLAEADAAPLYPLRRAAVAARAPGADNALLG